MDNVSKEKETVKDQFEQQLEQERIKFEEREFALKKEYTAKLYELEKQQKIFHDKIDLTIGEERIKMEQVCSKYLRKFILFEVNYKFSALLSVA